ncbi:MAG: teichuronic acid exporter [Bacteroidia bacterium]
MSIAKKAANGFAQFLGRNMLSKVMGLGAMVILARELSPHDFGIVSITQVLLVIIASFATTGISEFLLSYQKKDVDTIFQATFWFNLALTTVVSILALIILPFWTDTYKDERIYELGILVVISFIFMQLKMTPKTYLSKNLEFSKQIKVESIFIIIVPILKVAAVLTGFGVYSLVLPTVIMLPIETFFLYRAAGFKIKFNLYVERWLEIFRFTKHLIGSSILGMASSEGDKLIIGKFVSLEALGIYNLAYQLANFFSTNVVGVTTNILSATLPKLRHDMPQLRERYFQFLKSIFIAVGPLLILFALGASELLNVVYGNKWDAAVLPLQILIVYAFFRALTSSYGSIMNTMHLPRKSLIMNAFYTPCHIIGSLIGVQFGVIGLAASVTIVKLIFVQWGILQSMEAIGLKFASFYQKLARFFVMAIIAILSTLVVKLFLVHQFENKWLVLCLTSVSFAFFFWGAQRQFNKVGMMTISDFLGKMNVKLQLYFNKVFVA